MTTTQYNCPFCRASIGVDDVNVATDIALCRACGKTSAFSLIAGNSGIALDVLAAPPKGIKVEKDFRGATKIFYRRLSPILFFLIPFTAFWSGFSMWGIYGTQFKKGHFELTQSLFGIPFLLGTIVLVSAIVFILFGKWVITLDNGTGTVFVSVGTLGWTRRFTYNRSTLVSLRLTNMRVNNVPQNAILVRTDGQDFTFATGLKSDAQQFIAATIMQVATKG